MVTLVSPVCASGREGSCARVTITESYLDVAADLPLPDELFAG